MSTMRFTRLQLKNWKNFKSVDIPLAGRTFVIGPNAVGKSNLLLALRFLRDIAAEDGGLVKAVAMHHGLTALRSLHARQSTTIEIRVEIKDDTGNGWRYELGFDGDDANRERPVVKFERVIALISGIERTPFLLDRSGNSEPDLIDGKPDPEGLAQTILQQATANRNFRGLVEFLRGVSYLHIVPQLLREPQSPHSSGHAVDPYGRDLLDRIRQKGIKEQQSRLRRIQKVLKVVVPQFKKLSLRADVHGNPHLECRFEHWRGVAALQNETQFSD
ncbi:MAG TPA: AAA family ATPase, partial [Opitutaceae bacterium]|nr:AAA family ATPase [Opitutaceae bacterium]